VQIVVPPRFGDLADELSELPILVHSMESGWDDRLAETTFYVPEYMSGARGMAIVPRMPKLEVVQVLSAGVDHVRSLLPERVTLCNARGVHDASTAEHAVALALAGLRGLGTFRDRQRAHSWQSETLPSLADRRVMLLGYGSIGAAIEERLRPFEVEIVRVARTPRFLPEVSSLEDLPRLLPRIDVLIIVVPLTSETRGLVDRRVLSMLPDGALVVNVARGPVVVTEDLVAELARGRLRAALDVTDPEPLPESSPLWELENCLVTPHVGGDTTAFEPRGRELVRRNITRYFAGLPLLNVVTGEY
jgi:phosphoglycerate dehydrogenase-like enzyme